MEKIQLFPVCKELMVKGKDGKHEVGRKERTDTSRVRENAKSCCAKAKITNSSNFSVFPHFLTSTFPASAQFLRNR